jgi:hypothetical protein
MVLVIIASFDRSVAVAVTAPPRTPDTQDGRDLEKGSADFQALIEEARRRARRRRRIIAAVVLAVVVAGAVAFFGMGGGNGVSLGRAVREGSPGSSTTQSGEGRWRPSHGPEGGTVFALAVDPGNPEIVYAGGWGSIFKSTNGGDTWNDVTTDPWTRVTALAIDPTRTATVYAGTDRGVSKTTDGGRSWHSVNAGLFDGETRFQRGHRLGEGFLSALVINAHRPDTVFAMTDRGLFRTTNGGARWRTIGPRPSQKRSCGSCPSGLYGLTVAVAIDPNRARTVYASWSGDYGANLYKSADGGDSWHPIEGKAPRPWLRLLALDPHRSGAIYGVDQALPGVIKSTDGGVTWRVVGLAQRRIGSLWVDPGRPETLYATDISRPGVLESTDGGATWRGVGKGELILYGSVVTSPQASGTVYAAGEDGFVKSVDGGRTWLSANTGLVSTSIDALILAPGSSKILYAATRQGMFKSADGGRAWRLANSGLGKKSVIALAVSPQSPGAIYAGTRGFGVSKSTDGGLSWRPVNAGLPAKIVETLAIDPQSPSTVYVGASSRGVFKTVNGGATWRATNGVRNVQALAVDPREEGRVFAGTTRGLFRSKDGGDSWQLVTTAPGAPTPLGKWGVSDPDTFAAIAINPLNPEIVYAGIRTGGILKSSDGGDTWVASNTGLTDERIRTLAIDARDPRILYASVDLGLNSDGASTGAGVFRTTDGARSWHRLGRGLTTAGVAALAIDPAGRTLFAGTHGDGVVDFKLAR